MNASEHLQQELIEMSGVFVQWTATSLLYKCTSQAITPCNHVGTDTLFTGLLSRKRKTLCLVSFQQDWNWELMPQSSCLLSPMSCNACRHSYQHFYHCTVHFEIYVVHSRCTVHYTHAALRHAATSPTLYNDVILPSVLT